MLNRVRRKKRPFLALIGGLISLFIVGVMIFLTPPDSALSLGILKIPVLWIFLVLTAAFCFCLPLFAFKSKKHGILLSFFVITYLIFRLSGLSHPLFLIILIGLLLTLELLFTSKHT